jgi:hypothetical protein
VAAYSSTIDTLFLVAVPFAVAAFGLTWLLPEISMRRQIGETSDAEASAMEQSSSE